MESALFELVRLVLLVVFAVAGISKFGDRAGTRDAVRGFGLPEVLVPLVAGTLPAVELIVAAGLIPGSTARPAALGAALLLAAFSAGIATNLARGKRPDCHCFGQLHSEPVGWRTIARNVALMGGAAFVASRAGAGTPAIYEWVTGLTPAGLAAVGGGLAAAVVIGVQWRALKALRVEQARLVERVAALEAPVVAGARPAAQTPAVAAPPPAGQTPAVAAPPPAGQTSSGRREIGSPAPDFDLPDLDGKRVTLASLGAAGKPVMLLFTDPKCGPCNELMPDIARWQREHAGVLTIALVSRLSVKQNASKATKYGLENVLLQDDREVAEAYRYQGTPGAVVVDPDGRLASPVVGGAPAINALIARWTSKQIEPSQTPVRAALPVVPSAPAAGALDIAIGAVAPDIAGRDLDGRRASLRDWLEGETVVLFWNPSCGFCRRMLPELKAWEASGNAPRKLILVSTGTPEANRAQGLSSPVLLDDAGPPGRAYRAPGTPSAILIDENGFIASEMAVGAEKVMALAGATRSIAPDPGDASGELETRRGVLRRLGAGAAGAFALLLPSSWAKAEDGCRRGLTRCNGKCVNLRTSEKHCGRCGRACAEGKFCSKGKCCPIGTRNCGGVCVNLRKNESHCGACGNVCAAGTFCSKGKCCPTGTRNCGGVCVNLQGDESNCGACGAACSEGTLCSNGLCCPTGTTNCNGFCIDLPSSPTNCGACGNSCPSGECVDGTCVPVVCTPGETRSCYSGPPGTENVGVCQSGTQTCNAQGTAFGPCQGEVLPSQETCNGLDDDCDGFVDEGFDLGAPCQVGTGACQRSGVLICASNGTSVVCSAQPGQPQPETCNGIDDDCDGLVDEGNPGGGQACNTGQAGVCAQGVTQCVNGNLVCVRVTDPSSEVCDGLDNNCDGVVDEGVICPPAPNAVTACQNGNCVIAQCDAGFANCDNNASNGCETNVTNNNLHCGACGVVCAQGTTCINSTCVPN